MKNLFPFFFLFCLAVAHTGFAQEETEADTAFDYAAEALRIDSSFNYQTGTIDLKDGMASLNVPQGYK